MIPGLRIYIDRRDWRIGYYRGDTHHYVCPLPTVVVRWPNKAERTFYTYGRKRAAWGRHSRERM